MASQFSIIWETVMVGDVTRQKTLKYIHPTPLAYQSICGAVYAALMPTWINS